MNVKKSLENRIRGWFPKEPYLISTRVKVDSETKQQPLLIPPGYDVSATKTAGLQAIYLTALGLFFTYLFSFLVSDFSFPLTYVIAWIIAGLTVGAISGGMYTQNQLNRLSKNHQVHPNIRDMILLSVPISILFLIGIFTSWFLYDTYMQGSALLVLLASVFSLGISAQTTMYTLFSTYEKRENIRLMRMVVGWRIIAIPKPPNNNVNRSEIPASRIMRKLNLSTVIFTNAIALILLGVTMFVDWPFPIGTILWIATFSVEAVGFYLIYRLYVNKRLLTKDRPQFDKA